MKKLFLMLALIPLTSFSFELQTCDANNIEGCVAENFSEINLNVENYIEFKSCVKDISFVSCVNENFALVKEQYTRLGIKHCSPATFLCCVNDNFQKISEFLNP